MKRYICLEEYNCRCTLGKPVAYSTMLNHRRAANAIHVERGVVTLPVGPKYSHELGDQIRRRAMVASIDPKDEERALSFRGAEHVEDTGGSQFEWDGLNWDDRDLVEQPEIDVHRNMSTDGLEMEVSSRSGKSPGQADGDRLLSGHAFDGRGFASSASREAFVENPSAPCYPVTPTTRNRGALGSHQAARHLNAGEEPQSESRDLTARMLQEEVGEDDEGVDSSPLVIFEGEVSDEESFLREGIPSFRPIQRERFFSWAEKNKAWVKLALYFTPQRALMRQVLRNLSAPYKTWKTVHNNIIKYASLGTQRFMRCKNHMLLWNPGLHGTSSDMTHLTMSLSSVVCDECVKNGTDPELDYIEYIPLLPRLRAWVGSASSAELLFKYRQENCILNSQEHMGQSGGTEARSWDYFNGSIYKDIVDANGGENACAFDIFIAPSSDGFPVFDNQSYEAWPIAALNLNLPPTCRFLMKNVIPFSFVGSTRQPKRIDTFFAPLTDEFANINANGGTKLMFHDGVERNVRVHVLWVTFDLQGLAKAAGTVGPSGKRACHFCDFEAFYLRSSKRYYYPSAIRLREDRGRFRIKRSYDPWNLPLRSPQDSRRVQDMLSDNTVKRAKRNELSTATGVTGKTRLFDLPTMIPFESFPIDTMHLGMNVAKHMMSIFKGDNDHLKRITGFREESYVISREGWEMIDAEMGRIGDGTSQAGFGPAPGMTSLYSSWKAAELKQFVLSYWLVVLDGHLPRSILHGLSLFTALVDLWSRASLSDGDIARMGRCAVAFFQFHERECFRYEQQRAGLCKLVMHLLLHIRENVERCGPPVNYSQFWVERFIGFTKKRMNARTKAAEAMCEAAKLLEGYKVFYDEHFVTVATHADYGEEDCEGATEVLSAEEVDDGNAVSFIMPRKLEQLLSRESRALRLRQFLFDYIKVAEGLSSAEAIEEMRCGTLVCYGGAKVECGGVVEVFSAKLSHRKKGNRSRGNFYVAVEFHSVHDYRAPAPSVEQLDVWYGRVLKIIQYDLLVRGATLSRTLMLVDWALDLHVTESGQVYHNQGNVERVFRDATIVELYAVRNSIGVIEHQYPQVENRSSRSGRKTFLLDPHRDVDDLLSETSVSVDGRSRHLRGLSRRARRR